MARTKGSLNKRTRLALSEASEGKLEEGGVSTIKYLLRIVSNDKKDESVRLQAANIVLPYLKPKLASADITAHSSPEMPSHAQLMGQLEALIAANPQILKGLGYVPAPLALIESGSESGMPAHVLAQQPIRSGE